MKNQNILKIIKYFTWIAPFLMILSFIIHLSLTANQGIYATNYFFVAVLILISILNCFALLIVAVYDAKKTSKDKMFSKISLLFGTPIVFILLFLFGAFFSMQFSLEETKYLQNECFTKRKNFFIAENNYNYSTENCSTAKQDSIIIVEVYRWGTIRKCRIVLNDIYQEIDTSKITFLTLKQKKEILSY